MSWRGNGKGFWLATITLAIVVGALSVAPYLLAVRAIGADYRGIPFLYNDDEDIYLLRMQEIVDGHTSVGSPFFYEYKDQPAIQPPTAEWGYVILSRMTHLSLPDTLVLAKFLFPVFLFLLVFALAWKMLPADRLCTRFLGATAIGLLVIFGYDALSVSDILHAIKGEDIGVRLLVWTRPVNPIIGALVVFGYLNLLWEALVNRRNWALVGAGILLGAATFYFFSWGILISATAVLGLGCLIAKKWKSVQKIAVTVLISFIVSATYWFNILHSMGGEAGRIMAMRNGMMFTHAPLLNKTLLAALVVFFVASFFLARRNKGWKAVVQEPWWIACISLLIGGLLALNQQVITGREIWPYHFVQYSEPFVFVVVLIVLLRLFWLRPKIASIICWLVIAASLISGTFSATTYRSGLSDFRNWQKESAVYSWLNSNAPKDSVVLAISSGERLARQIPAFTWCNDYMVYWLINGIPDERILHNFFVYLRLEGVTSENAETYLREHHSLIRGYFYEDWNQMFKTTPDSWSDQKAVDLAVQYREFLKQPLVDELKRFRLDYVLIEQPLVTKIQQILPTLKPIATFESTQLFQLPENGGGVK